MKTFEFTKDDLLDIIVKHFNVDEGEYIAGIKIIEYKDNMPETFRLEVEEK